MTVLSFYYIFFYKKISQVQKSTKPLTAYKNKKMCIKYIQGKKNHSFTYLRFMPFLGCVFMLLVLFITFSPFSAYKKSLNDPSKLVFVRKTI